MKPDMKHGDREREREREQESKRASERKREAGSQKMTEVEIETDLEMEMWGSTAETQTRQLRNPQIAFPILLHHAARDA